MLDRRNFIYLGAAAAAGVLGWGVAQKQWGPTVPKHPANQAAEAAFWGMAWATPDGKPLPMKKFSGKPLLLNFWATWCPPCLQELPLLDAFYQQHQAQGWQVLALAVDNPTAVQRWLRSNPLRLPVAVAASDGVALSQSLGNASGGLPFSVLFAGNGHVVQQKTGALSNQELAQWRQLA